MRRTRVARCMQTLFRQLHEAQQQARAQQEAQQQAQQHASVPRAAVTGGLLPAHFAEPLRRVAEQRGYSSPYWISGAQVRRRSVTLLPGAQPMTLPSDTKPAVSYAVLNFDSLVQQPLELFFAANAPSQKVIGDLTSPFVYKEGKWKVIGDAQAAAALVRLKTTMGFAKNWWLPVAEMSDYGLQLSPEHVAEEHEVVVREGGIMANLYHIEQTTNPTSLIPKEHPDENLPGG